jgi:hypothetical protein
MARTIASAAGVQVDTDRVHGILQPQQSWCGPKEFFSSVLVVRLITTRAFPAKLG